MDDKNGIFQFFMDNDTVQIYFERVKGKPGKSKGSLMYNNHVEANIFVESSGTLENVFYKDAIHVVAWFVNIYVDAPTHFESIDSYKFRPVNIR